MADSTSPTRKTLAILGSDGDLVTGVLVYMVSCSISTSTINLLAYKQTLGGIHLPILAELQEQDINSYAKAVQEMKDTKNELYFYTPRHRVTVQDHLPCVGVDCLLFVVTAPQDILTLSQKGSGSLFAQNKVVILVEPSLAEKTREAVGNLEFVNPDVVSSALQCENFIEPFFDTPGQASSTLVTALEKVFSKPP